MGFGFSLSVAAKLLFLTNTRGSSHGYMYQNFSQLKEYFFHEYFFTLLVFMNAGERQAHINIADGKKSSVILASEAAKMDQVNRAQGELFCNR